MSGTLCASLLAKIDEQVDRTIHLIELLPAERADTAIFAEGWTPAMLLGHLLDCMSGVCAALAAGAPRRLEHFGQLRALPVNHACTPAEALERIAVYRAHIGEGFGVLRDSDLARLVPTMFVPSGETLLTLLLGNFEHLINHKHQLFVLLRALGCPVGTSDLYRLRG
jgi:DinB family protein